MPTPRCAAVLLFSALLVPGAGAEPLPIAYRLDFNGPETSTVTECPRLGPCFTYPIDGRIEITLGPIAPTIRNLDSRILIPPDSPGAASVAIWENLEILVGEYTSDTPLMGGPLADVSMRFAYPLDDTSIPYHELDVHLTGGGTELALTGGYIGVALVSDPNSVAFNVFGRAVPEPATLALAAVAAASVAGARRRSGASERLTQAVLR